MVFVPYTDRINPLIKLFNSVMNLIVKVVQFIINNEVTYDHNFSFLDMPVRKESLVSFLPEFPRDINFGYVNIL